MFSLRCCGPTRAMASLFLRFPDHTNHAPNSVGLLLTSDQIVAENCTWHHTTLTTDTLAPPARFETEIPLSKRPQNQALDRAATGTGKKTQIKTLFTFNSVRQLHCYCCNFMHQHKHLIWYVRKIFYQIIGSVQTFLCKFTTACCKHTTVTKIHVIAEVIRHFYNNAKYNLKTNTSSSLPLFLLLQTQKQFFFITAIISVASKTF